MRKDELGFSIRKRRQQGRQIHHLAFRIRGWTGVGLLERRQSTHFYRTSAQTARRCYSNAYRPLLRSYLRNRNVSASFNTEQSGRRRADSVIQVGAVLIGRNEPDPTGLSRPCLVQSASHNRVQSWSSCRCSQNSSCSRYVSRRLEPTSSCTSLSSAAAAANVTQRGSVSSTVSLVLIFCGIKNGYDDDDDADTEISRAYGRNSLTPCRPAMCIYKEIHSDS